MTVWCSEPGHYPKFGWFIKTDINGNKLWEKTIGNKNRCCILFDHLEDKEGNIYIAADFQINKTNADPVIIKLNPCGELLWVKSYPTQCELAVFKKIILLPCGDMIVFAPTRGTGSNCVNMEKRLCLLRINPEGKIVWENYYMKNFSKVYNQIGRHIQLLKNGNILITGQCHPVIQNKATMKAFYTCIDIEGKIIWEKIIDSYVAIKDDYNHSAFFSVESSNQKQIYTGARSFFNYDKSNPALLKIDSQGNKISCHTLKTGGVIGRVGEFAYAGEGKFIGHMSWLMEFLDNTEKKALKNEIINNPFVVYKKQTKTSKENFPKIDKFARIALFDTLMNIQKEELTMDGFGGSIIKTSDNKFLYLYFSDPEMEESPTAYLHKYDKDLNYAKIDNRKLDYDYLCSKAIKSDTIFIEDFTPVKLNPIPSIENKHLLKVFPNPCVKFCKIILPEFIQVTQNAEHSSAVRQYYEYQNNTTIEILDIKGNIVFQSSLSNSQKEININTSQWQKGIFMVRLIYKNQIVGKCKILKG
ncbi:MAG: T9SS type A sorting domain-containing protein [Bacteroidales bacterium]